jgi:hypothetical protein
MPAQHARSPYCRRRTGTAVLAVSGAVLAHWGAALAVTATAAPQPGHRAATSPVATALGSVLGVVAPLVAPPRPATPPGPTTAPPAPDRAPAPGPVNTRCAAARQDVEATGLVLPDRFEFRCPGNTELSRGGRQHWGVTCSYASLCPGGAYVAVNLDRIGPSEARLRYVVAHEICHAVDVEARRPLREPAADACAAAHGFPRV